MTRTVVGLLSGLLVASGLVSGCVSGGSPPDAPFALSVAPREVQGFAIPGQEVVYLVSLAEGTGAPVTVTVDADGAAARVERPDLGLDAPVAEVVVVPDAASVGSSVTATIAGRRGAASDTETLTFDVIDGADDRAASATVLRDRFVAWLAANRPDLGITAATAWEGTMVSPQWLVVSHYLFFSAEWEAHVSWHVMIAPHDWGRVDLRRRFRETAPSAAFEIASVSGDTDPRPAEVPPEVWR